MIGGFRQTLAGCRSFVQINTLRARRAPCAECNAVQGPHAQLEGERGWRPGNGHIIAAGWWAGSLSVYRTCRWRRARPTKWEAVVCYVPEDVWHAHLLAVMVVTEHTTLGKHCRARNSDDDWDQNSV